MARLLVPGCRLDSGSARTLIELINGAAHAVRAAGSANRAGIKTELYTEA